MLTDRPFLIAVIVVAAILFVAFLPMLRRWLFVRKFKGKHGLAASDGDWQGWRYRVYFNERTKHRAAYLDISLNKPTGMRFFAWRMNWWLKKCRQWRIGSSPKTGDPVLDARWYFETSSPLKLKPLLESDRARALSELGLMGIQVVAVGSEGVGIRISPFAMETEKDLDVVFSVLPLMEKLAGPAAAAAKKDLWESPLEEAFSHYRHLTQLALLMILFMGISILGLKGELLFPAEGFRKGIVLWISAFIPLSLIAIMRGHWRMPRLIPLMGVLIPMALPFCIIAGFTLNALLDNSPETSHIAKVVSTRAPRSKDGQKFKAVLESWRPDHPTLEIFINQETYHSLVPNQSRLAVYTHPGLLGMEWVSHWERVQ